MSFAMRLKQAMTDKDISLSDLSDMTGIGKPGISQYRSGKNIPKEKALEKLAEVLGISAAYLLDAPPPRATIPINALRNVSVTATAKIMGVAPQYVRDGIINDRFKPPIGSAVMGSTRWKFHIPPNRLAHYLMADLPIATPSTDYDKHTTEGEETQW